MSTGQPGAGVTDAPYRIAYQASQTPAHLALVCAMAGVPWTLRDDLRVADLGCGRGYVANTLAAANPGWQVLGIDHSPVQIAEAAATARLARLDNVRFIEADLAEAGADAGGTAPPLDVVLLHGVWTWVSDAVRQGIVRLLQQRLRPGGLVYIGYNAMPAAGADWALQRLLLQLAGPMGDGAGSVAAAAGAMARLRQLAPVLPLPRTAMLQRLLHEPPLLEPAFVAHEFLSPHWRPVFHEELCAALQPGKLSFVGSCNLFESLPGLLADPARDALLAQQPPGSTGGEFIKDLCLPRSFRADVFVRGVRSVDPVVALDALCLGATGPLPERSPVLATGVAEAALPQPAWDAVRARLAAGPCAMADLRQVPGLGRLPPSQLLAVLAGNGLVLPMWDGARQPAGGAAARLNRTLAQRHAPGGQGAGHFALAAPAAAGGLPADALDLALVAALLAGSPADDAHALARRLQADRPAAAADADAPGRPVDALDRQVADRLAQRLPVWRQFGVL